MCETSSLSTERLLLICMTMHVPQCAVRTGCSDGGSAGRRCAADVDIYHMECQPLGDLHVGDNFESVRFMRGCRRNLVI